MRKKGQARPELFMSNKKPGPVTAWPLTPSLKPPSFSQGFGTYSACGPERTGGSLSQDPPPATIGFVNYRFAHATCIAHSAMGSHVLPAAPPGRQSQTDSSFCRLSSPFGHQLEKMPLQTLGLRDFGTFCPGSRFLNIVPCVL